MLQKGKSVASHSKGVSRERITHVRAAEIQDRRDQTQVITQKITQIDRREAKRSYIKRFRLFSHHQSRKRQRFAVLVKSPKWSETATIYRFSGQLSREKIHGPRTQVVHGYNKELPVTFPILCVFTSAERHGPNSDSSIKYF